MKVNVSCWLGSFFVWEVENGRRDALVVEMVMPFVSEGEGEKPFFSSEVGKENISSELEESIFLGKVSADEGEEKESFVLVAVWETYAVEEVEQERENVAFWWVVERDFSCVDHF